MATVGVVQAGGLDTFFRITKTSSSLRQYPESLILGKLLLNQHFWLDFQSRTICIIKAVILAVVLFLSLQLEHIEVLQVTGSLEDQNQQQEKKLNAEVEAAMQQRLGLPVRVALKKDNCIKQVYTHLNDEEWSLNIKRGLVNLFQISPPQGDREREFATQIEVRS